MVRLTTISAAVIVAHPDDEVLWAGGTILGNPSWRCFIVSLCRKNDANRAPRFYQSMKLLKAEGVMGDLDDGPDQFPLEESVVEKTILDLMPSKHFDLIITHHPRGEYTRHLRHEEVSKAVILLWHAKKISANELWTFAYEDGNRQYFPRAVENSSIYHELPDQVWLKKYSLITDIYGFEAKSWEARTTPRAEAFITYTDSFQAVKSLNNENSYV